MVGMERGWEIRIKRELIQSRTGLTRTVGQYQVYHDGEAVSALCGRTAESPGPGSNSTPGNKKRIEPGRYPLWTQDGTNYVTIGYTSNQNHAAIPRPSIELKETGNRSEILIHPGRGFLSSVGCINLCKTLPSADTDLEYVENRLRVIAIIADLRAYCGDSFPTANGQPIPHAWAVVDGEP